MNGCWILIVLPLVCSSGCVQTPYRDVVHDNGEGSITVEHIPTTPAPAPARSAASAPAPLPAVVTDQQRVAALEAKVKTLETENQELKQATTTTAPAKD